MAALGKCFYRSPRVRGLQSLLGRKHWQMTLGVEQWLGKAFGSFTSTLYLIVLFYLHYSI